MEVNTDMFFFFNLKAEMWSFNINIMPEMLSIEVNLSWTQNIPLNWQLT